jgi:hypothetical protein
MRYLIFSDRRTAAETLARLNAYWRQIQSSPGNWGGIWEHPVELKYAVDYDEPVSRAPELIPAGTEIVDLAEATRRGFYFGPLDGRFYRPLHKCQDAEILGSTLAGIYGHAPFPVVRSLFLAALSSLYSVREHLSKTLRGPAAKALPHYAAVRDWWEARRTEMFREGELLHFLYELNNSEKHGTPSVVVALHPLARYFGGGNVLNANGSQYLGNAMGLRLGAEGAFVSSGFAVGYEKWDLLPDPHAIQSMGFDGAEFTFAILGLPRIHLGQPIAGDDPVTVLKLAVGYHFDLVRGAIEKWNSSSAPS